jgi:hypothetical protein
MTKLHSFGASTQLPPSGQTAGRTPPTELSVSAYSLIDSIGQMGAAMSFQRDGKIYSENSPANYLYKVISGAVRTYKSLSNGRRQIRAVAEGAISFTVEGGSQRILAIPRASQMTDLELNITIGIR